MKREELEALQRVVEGGQRICWSLINGEPPCRHRTLCLCANDRTTALLALAGVVAQEAE